MPDDDETTISIRQHPTPTEVKLAASISSLSQLNDLRQRVLRNEPVSEDELRAAISFLRQDRRSAAESAPAKPKSKRIDSPRESAADILDSLL